jgi:hypothetical protein
MLCWIGRNCYFPHNERYSDSMKELTTTPSGFE